MQKLRQGIAHYWSGVRLPINGFLHRRRRREPDSPQGPVPVATYEDKMMRTRYPLDTYQDQAGTPSAPEVKHG